MFGEKGSPAYMRLGLHHFKDSCVLRWTVAFNTITKSDHAGGAWPIYCLSCVGASCCIGWYGGMEVWVLILPGSLGTIPTIEVALQARHLYVCVVAVVVAVVVVAVVFADIVGVLVLLLLLLLFYGSVFCMYWICWSFVLCICSELLLLLPLLLLYVLL